MTENQQNMLAVLSSAIWNTPLALGENPDWSGIVDELEKQKVYYLAVEKLPQEFRNHQGQMMQAMLYLNLLKVQQKAGEALDAAGIPYTVLKGSAVACYYEKPQYRTYGDIDILVSPDRFEKAKAVLLGLGFEEESGDERHCSMHWSNVELELHKRFTIGYENHAEALENRITAALGHTVSREINGCGFRCLPPVENGMVLALHVLQHLSEDGLGLRQILDLLCYAHCEITNENWNSGMGQAFADLGLDRIILTVARMGQLWFGFPDTQTWCNKADEKDCALLLEQLLEDGNFGRARDRSNRGAMDLFSVPFTRLYRYLADYGAMRWKPAQEYRVLRPAAAVYQLGHYGKQLLLRKNRENLNTNQKKAGQRLTLLKNMGISLKTLSE